jgi:uncharacterized membrane protein YcaP (DUF421 family)
MWTDMFVLAIPVLEKILRPALVYLALVVLLRIFGKRELAQLNPFDLVVLLSLSNTVQNAIIGRDDSVSGGVLGAFVLLAMNYLVVRVMEKNLTRELLTHSELLALLHRQGFYDVREVEQCVLEPGGSFAIRRKEPPASEIHYADVSRRLQEIDAKLARIVERA